MPCRRHRTWNPIQSQYTDMGPTCRCAIHWCGTSHCNTQLPILMSWVRPDREILPRPSTHTSESWALWNWYGGSQSKANFILISFTFSECKILRVFFPHLFEATRTQFELGGSHFSMMYWVTKLPPSFSGGFHDNTTESSRMFSTTGKRGGSGRSVKKIIFNYNFLERSLLGSFRLYTFFN